MFGWFKKKFFDTFGFKSVIKTQISLYLKFKKNYSEATENEILDMLLLSRIKSSSILPQFPPRQQELYYEQLLKGNKKTLEEVIFHIICYEYIISRKDWVIKHSTLLEQEIFEN